MTEQRSFAPRPIICAACVLVPGLACASLPGTASEVRTDGYQVRGFFQYNLSVDGRRDVALERHFEVQVEGCRWEIRVVRPEDTNNTVYVHRWDGTNLLYFMTRPERPEDAFGGLVEDCGVPFLWTSAGAAFPWLAYASGCYFRGQTNETATSLHRWKDATGQWKRFQRTCRWQLRQEHPYLPLQVQYVMDERHPLWAAFQKRTFIEEEMTATDFTNVQGICVPLQFTFRAYRPQAKPALAHDVRCILVVNGKATNISFLAKSDHPLQGRLYVEDRRFPEVAVVYPVTNEFLPPSDSPVVAQARKLAMTKTPRWPPRPPRKGIVVLLVAFLVLPLILYGAYTIAHRRKQYQSDVNSSPESS